MSFESLEGVEGGERGNTSMTLLVFRVTPTKTLVFCYGRSSRVELGSVAMIMQEEGRICGLDQSEFTIDNFDQSARS